MACNENYTDTRRDNEKTSLHDWDQLYSPLDVEKHQNRCNISSENFKSLKELSLHRCVADSTDELKLKGEEGENIQTSSATTDNASVLNVNEPQQLVRTRPAAQPYRCDECDMCFSRYALLVAHRTRHEKEQPMYYCGNCNVGFDSENLWLHHQDNGCRKPRQGRRRRRRKRVGNLLKPKESSYKCHYCPKYFKAVSTRNDHERNLHEGLRPHSCGDCGKTFYRKFNLAVHKRKHSTDRPHECKICNKKFKSNLYLKVHIQTHSENRRFMCETCGKVFKTLSVLESHKTIHTGECSYTCSVCSKPYRYQASLFIHMRTHTGQRPYTCNYCSASFMVKSHLTEHLRIHTGEKPFECRFCSACFSRTMSLKKHLKAHIRAGLDVNMDMELYHAKVQAHVTPREICTQRDISDQTSIFTSVAVDKPPVKEHIVLHTDLPTEEEALVTITIYSVGDGQSCVHSIDHPTRYRISTEAQLVIENTNLSEDYSMQGQEFIILDHPELVEVSARPEAPPVTQYTWMTNEQQQQQVSSPVPVTYHSESFNLFTGTPVIGTVVVAPLSGFNSSVNNLVTEPQLSYSGKTCRDTGLQHHQNKTGPDSGIYYLNKQNSNNDLLYLDKAITEDETYYCYKKGSDSDICPDPTGTSGDLYKDWMIPQSTITCGAVLESGVRMYNEPVSNEESPNGIQIDDIYRKRQEGGETLHQSVTGVEYLKRRTDHNKISGKSYEDILVDNKIHSILLTHQDLPINTVKNTIISSSNEDHDKFLLCVQKEGSQSGLNGDHSSTKCQRKTRKPLRKCQYCDTSYRYLALLEAHEAGHERQLTSTSSKTEDTKSKTHDVNQKFVSSCGISPTVGIKTLPFKCEICTCSFSFRSDLRKHVKLHSSKYQYTCTLCHQAFQQEIFLAKHQCGCPNNTTDELKTVGQVSDNESHLTSMLVSQNNAVNQIVSPKSQESRENINFQCEFCGKSFQKLFVLKVHKRKHTGERPFRCRVCSKTFISATHRKVHSRIHTGERPHVCQTCTKSFRLRSKLQNHIKQCQVSEKVKTCNTDSLESIRSSEPVLVYNAYVSENTDYSVHSASTCVTNTEKQDTLMSKNLTVITDEIIAYETGSLPTISADRCTVSNLTDDLILTVLETENMPLEEYKMFDPLTTENCIQTKVVAETQVRRKKVKELLQCRHCPKKFKFHSLLHSHERRHTGERPFSCSVCGKTFSEKSNLTVHIKIHTGERSFLCDYCGRYFMYKCSLEAHKRLHTKEQPFVCNICGKRFRYKTSRHVHLKRHAGVKAFKCDLCAKTFVTKVDMKVHRRSHTGERPYKCEDCDRTFSVRHRLADHRRLHSGEKPYKCQVCDMSFARIATQKLHTQKMHES